MSAPVPDRLSREELAERATVDAGFVDRLVELGVLAADADARFGTSDVYRTRLVAACERGGLPAEEIGLAIREGRLSLAFLDLPQYRWAGRTSETYGEFAARVELPFETLRDLVGSLGRRPPEATERTREDDGAIFDRIGVVLPLAGVDAVARIGRVYTDAMRRIAEAEAAFFDTHLVGALVATGLSYGEAIERASVLGAELDEQGDRMILALYHRQQERAWTEGIVEGLERIVEERGEARRAERVPSFAFVDLAGYTALTDEHGDETGARVASDLARLVERESVEHEGTPVKWLGDGVMVHFREAGAAVRATLSIVASAPACGLEAHAGIASGPVVMQDGDYFGRTVNLAARIAAGASAGQTLVSDAVVELAGDSPISFREVGPVELKGFARPVLVFEALPPV